MAYRRNVGKIFEVCCLGATLLSVVVLAVLLVCILYQGITWLDWQFLTSYPAPDYDEAGVKSSLVGSVYLVVLTALISVPVGVASAIYLEEYTTQNIWFKLVRTNIANLAGVPSIVFGMLGLAVFVRFLKMGGSLIAGACTLSLVILPIIIIASQEALRAVPSSLRNASYALGATRWQTISRQVLPASLPGIMTGVILSLSRALGETAPLIVMGAFAYVNFLPTKLSDPFSGLTLTINYWSGQPQAEFKQLAAATIIVLLAILFCMNAVAVFIRYRFTNQIQS